MNEIMKSLKKSVREYNRSKEKFTIANHTLTNVVLEIVKSNHSDEELDGLIKKLPKECSGTRILYEMKYLRQYTRV